MSKQKQNTILVTGGAGFVGSHLIEELVQYEKNRVISLDNYFTGRKDYHIEGAEYREGHTKNIEEHIPEDLDVIFHLGEYARVEQSVLEPELVYDLNRAGTRAVVDFWRNQGCKLVYAGSSTKFGDDGEARDASPYARTKAENTELIDEVGSKEDLPYAIMYFHNVYGPRERAGVYGTVVAQFKQMYKSGAPCSVVLPGTQTRHFTHVKDIVDGVLRVAQDGRGDGYEIGSPEAYSILDLAEMLDFEDEQIVYFPGRDGNRMETPIDTSQVEELGWEAKQSLPEHIDKFKAENERGEVHERRVLVIATTMHPVSGLAEDAFMQIARDIDVQFDVVTTHFQANTQPQEELPENVNIYRVGFGNTFDKYLLPILGWRKARRLLAEHDYLFAWSLLAGHGGLAGMLAARTEDISLLVTLADQGVDDLSLIKRGLLKLLLREADQVHGTYHDQEKQMEKQTQATLPRESLQKAGGFANALRFVYADHIRRLQDE